MRKIINLTIYIAGSQKKKKKNNLYSSKFKDEEKKLYRNRYIVSYNEAIIQS